MNRKFLCLVIAVMSALLFTGCSDSKKIDKASIAETVTVRQTGGQTIYTFYLLSSSENVKSVSVFANSLESACYLAKENYIPNLSLSKFELFLADENLSFDILKTDLQFISSEYYLSPLIMVTLADGNAIKYISESKEAPKEVEEHLMLLKNKNNETDINSLSVFNSIYSKKQNEFSMACINYEDELSVSARKISVKK